MKSYIKRLNALLLLAPVIFANSCKKFVEVPPPDDKIVATVIYTDPKLMSSAMTGLYDFAMAGNGISSYFGNGGDGIYMSLATDDASTTSTSSGSFYSNTFNLNSESVLPAFWKAPYTALGRVNSFIAGVSGSTAISDAQKANFLGQARLMRAFHLFYLSLMFGDIPLPLTGDFASNAFLPRSPRASVDSAILADMLYAQQNLTADAIVNNYTFNHNTANALLARFYAYKQNWAAAEAAATAVIGSNKYSLVAQPSTAFDRGSTEAIFQISNAGASPFSGFISQASNFASTSSCALTPSLINSFEANDLRYTQWITKSGTFYLSKKYLTAPPKPQELVLIRLADIILLRAEARAQQSKLTDATDDINLIRARAQLTTLPYGLTKDALLLAAMKERRVEFFTENITRWFDLSRWGTMQTVMSAAKPTTWTPKAALFPVMNTELTLNPNLKQTTGY